MLLFFDTETTGKADFKSHPSAEHQPKLVQLAAILCDDDGVEHGCFSCIVKPDGYEIPIEATSIHGISTEHAIKCGVHRHQAVALFGAMLSIPYVTTVAHNHSFDELVMLSEFHRCGIAQTFERTFCTMNAMTSICQLPGKYGDYKWPKLQEAHLHAFGCGFDGAHSALEDCRAAMRVFFWIKNQPKNPA